MTVHVRHDTEFAKAYFQNFANIKMCMRFMLLYLSNDLNCFFSGYVNCDLRNKYLSQLRSQTFILTTKNANLYSYYKYYKIQML